MCQLFCGNFNSFHERAGISTRLVKVDFQRSNSMESAFPICWSIVVYLGFRAFSCWFSCCDLTLLLIPVADGVQIDFLFPMLHLHNEYYSRLCDYMMYDVPGRFTKKTDIKANDSLSHCWILSIHQKTCPPNYHPSL
jgi:hypothetical protein